MKDILLYLFQVSLLLAAAQVVYRVFLQRLTFYQANRFVLLGSLLFSCLAPLLSFPTDKNSVSPLSAFTDVSLPANLTPSFPSPPNLPAEASLLESVMEATVYVYGVIVIGFALQLVLRVVSLVRLVNRSQKETYTCFTLLLHPSIEAPFSFYKYIGINKKTYPPATLTNILHHEQVHLRQGHSFDILLTELYLIFFWFSPFAWWHKKLIALNLEYLADQVVLKAGVPLKSYQLSLLSMSVNKTRYTLSNPFSLSSMKTRIHKINQAPSSTRSGLNYIWLLVVGIATLFIGGLSKAHQKESIPSEWKAARNTTLHTQIPTRQSRILKGIVKTAEAGKPMKDVQVIVVGTSKNTTTDNQGKFSIEVSENDQILEFIPMDFETIKSDNYYPALAMQITASQEMIVLLSRFPLSPLKDTTIYFMDGQRISEQEYERQRAKGYFPMELIGRPGLKKINLINMGNVD